MSLVIKVKKLNEKSKIPTYESTEASGADLSSVEDVWIPPGESRVVDCGIAIEPNKFCDIQFRSRSGLAAKYQISILNSPGTIDTDYRGSMKAILYNHGKESFHVEKEMRVGQLVAHYPTIGEDGNIYMRRAEFVEVEELSETSRGSGGFGSTGLK